MSSGRANSSAIHSGYFALHRTMEGVAMWLGDALLRLNT
ncbi:MAG: hypothetical protein OJF49_002402 [Ktedonobacterales bacterium]|nr:MAG: hypothetical protein OJF49_002402 [Ktedonobacterales bacterium]